MLPRKLHRRVRSSGRAGDEERFQTRLLHDPAAGELLLSPHWDDAVLDCWSLLASDRSLSVVNVFAGVPKAGAPGVWEAVIGASDPAARARARMAEDAHALARAGRAPVNLALPDSGFRARERYRIGLRELDEALVAEVPAASHVYVPAGIGAHVDHVLTRRYGCALARAGVPVSLYAELPYCVYHGWPAWVDGREPSPVRDVDAYWLSFLGSISQMPALRSAEVVRLDESSASVKREALESYEASLNFAFRSMLADPAFHGFEVRWRLV